VNHKMTMYKLEISVQCIDCLDILSPNVIEFAIF
jgi:hypothetical protein